MRTRRIATRDHAPWTTDGVLLLRRYYNKYLFGIPQMHVGHAAVRVFLVVRQMDPRRQVQLQVRPDRVQPDLSVVFSGQSAIAPHGQHLKTENKKKKTLSNRSVRTKRVYVYVIIMSIPKKHRDRTNRTDLQRVSHARRTRPTCDECRRPAVHGDVLSWSSS